MHRFVTLPCVSAPFRRAGLALAVLASMLAAHVARAQSATPVSRTVSLVLGASSYDASGTGTAPTFAVRLDAPLRTRWVLAEASFGYTPFDEQFSSSTSGFSVLEGQLQVQYPAARVRPYIGVGGGWAGYLSNSAGRDVTGTASVAAGLRVPASPRVLARAELRVRGWSPYDNITDGFAGAAAETTIGVAWRF